MHSLSRFQVCWFPSLVDHHKLKMYNVLMHKLPVSERKWRMVPSFAIVRIQCCGKVLGHYWISFQHHMAIYIFISQLEQEHLKRFLIYHIHS